MIGLSLSSRSPWQARLLHFLAVGGFLCGHSESDLVTTDPKAIVCWHFISLLFIPPPQGAEHWGNKIRISNMSTLTKE